MITSIKILSVVVAVVLYLIMVFIGGSFMTVHDADFNFTAVRIENINSKKDE